MPEKELVKVYPKLRGVEQTLGVIRTDNKKELM